MHYPMNYLNELFENSFITSRTFKWLPKYLHEMDSSRNLRNELPYNDLSNLK